MKKLKVLVGVIGVEMTKPQKRAIEADAVKAATDGESPNDACPWPFRSEEALLWLAAWAVAKGKA